MEMDIGIKVEKRIEAGKSVLFSTSAPITGGPYKYKFTWCIVELSPPGKTFEYITETPELVWNVPPDLTSGYVEVSVNATPEPMVAAAGGKGAAPPPPPPPPLPPHPPTGMSKQRFAVADSKFSKDDLWRVKENVDEHLESLTGEVGKIADAVGTVAGKLPGAGGPIAVSLQPQGDVLTADLQGLAAFFGGIRNRTAAIGFSRYNEFISRLLCEGVDDGEATCGSPPAATVSDYGAPSIRDRRDDLRGRPSIYGVDSYQLLKLATEAFLVFETGIAIRPPRDARTGQYGYRDNFNNFVAAVPTDEVPGESRPRSVTFQDITSRLDRYLSRGSSTGTTYLRRIVDALIGPDTAHREERLPFCDGILRHRLSCPSLIELIWSYWHEEGMLVQSLNVIALRFQNRRGPMDRDPLAHLEIDPLRPLNNVLWGYVQDEMHRLTVPRRAYEYDHHYGLTIFGKAVPSIRPADSRSKFLEAFHNLLHRTAAFYHDDADTTVVADAFPLLNALREVHLLLAEGAHNQFGDLPWTARAEMLVQQWLLARPEIREFVRGRAMVPYAEAWMGQVDTIKRLQGWSEVSVTNFHELAVFGEQILLSIRYHDWSAVNDQDEAKLWARYWKAEIQRYVHSYRAVTGVDLTTEPVDAKAPWIHLRGRLADEQKRRAGRP